MKKWGEGASLIRKEWKAREVDMKNHRDGGMAVDEDEDDDNNDEEEEEEEEEPDDVEATPRMVPRQTIGVHSPQSSLSSHPDTHNNRNTNNNDLTNLTDSLDSLSLVPNSIRFGRGGKSGGFIPRGRHNRGGKHGRDVMEVDVVPLGTDGQIRGRGRGRGRK